MNGSRERSVRTYIAGLKAGDVAAALAHMTDDVAFDMTRSQAPWRGVYEGKASLERLWRTMSEALEGFHQELHEIRAVGGERMVLRLSMRGSGTASRIPVEAAGGWVTRFEGARISHATLFQSFGEALLCARRETLAESRLYFVCEARPHGADPASLLEAAIRGGVDVIQMREKAPRCAEELIAFAAPFARQARRHGALFFLNDTPELVLPCGADGVHVGQDDIPVCEARAQAGGSALVGLSTHSPAQFDAALAAGGAARPDQISAGPIWETPTKEGRPATGLGLIEHAAARAPEIAWFAIGGIDSGNVAEVVRAGARRVVVVRAIRDAEDPEAAARELRAALGG